MRRDRNLFSRRPSPPQMASFLLLLLVAIVACARAARLASGSKCLDARGESAFFSWAYRGPAVPRHLSAAASGLKPGDLVWIEYPPSRLDAQWLRVMGIYFLPGQSVLGASEIGSAAARPKHGSVLVLRELHGTDAVR